MSARHLTVLPERLTPGATFRCADYGTTLTVAECAARFGGRSRGDTCDGCEHGQRTLAFVTAKGREVEQVKIRGRTAWARRRRKVAA